MQSEKYCPVCKETKKISEFSKYFSKSRNKYRVQNYCKICQKTTARIRSKEYYQNNKEERKAYAKQYRKENKEKTNKTKRIITRRYREQLQDCYVVDRLSQKLNCTAKDIRQIPEIIDTYRNIIKIKRKIKEYGKE